MAEPSEEELLLLAAARKRMAEAQTAGPAEERPEQTTLEKIQGAAGALANGTLAGLGDEAAGAVRAGLDYVLPNSHFDLSGKHSKDASEDQSLADRYRLLRNDSRATNEQFADEHKKTALALELAGGFATPVPGSTAGKLAAKLLPKGAAAAASNAARTAVDLVPKGAATTVLEKAANLVRNPGVRTAAEGPVNVAADVGTGLGTAMASSAARGGVQGAVAGYGNSEGDSFTDDLAAAAKGAVIGAGTSGLLTGTGGYLGDAISKRRIARNLIQEDGSQLPIHLADREGSLGKFYRDALGRIPFARAALAKQEQPFVAAAENAAENAGVQSRAMGQAVEENARVGKEAVKQGYDTTVDTVKDRAQSGGKALKRATQAAQQAEARQFTSSIIPTVLPEHGLPALNGVDTTNPKNVADAVIQWWKGPQAFAEVKGRSFPWQGSIDPHVERSIRGLLRANPEIALEAGNAVENVTRKVNTLDRFGHTVQEEVPSEPDFLQRMLGGTPDNETQISELSGDALMALRNTFATTANETGKTSARQIANKIDDYIRSHLDDQGVKQFNDNIGKYATAKQFVRASAQDKVRDTGLIDAKTWRKVADDPRKYGVFTEKQFPHEDLTDASVRRLNAIKDAQSANDIALREEKSAGLRQARRVRDQQKAQVAADERAGTAAHDAFKEGPLRQATQARADTQAARVQSHVSPWSAFASGASLAALPFMGSIPGLALGTGVAGGRLLASKAGQRAIAGQYDWQNKLRTSLLRGGNNKYAQQVARTVAGHNAGD